MRLIAFTGPSGSGKTTAIVALIGLYRQLGLRVGAMKHTHHEVNEIKRGDTALMHAAGASPVILAGRNEAVVFDKTTTRIEQTTPHDLLPYFQSCDLVFV